MTKTVWVWTEISGDGPHRQSLELFTAARGLGDAAAVVLHPAGGEALEALGRHGATVVHHGDDARYAEYLTEPQDATLATLIEAEQPDLILFSSTNDSRDVLARLVGHRPLSRGRAAPTFWLSRSAGAARSGMDHQF